MMTTKQLRQEISRIDRIIARIEAKPFREWPNWSSMLRELQAERRSLDLVVQGRQLEAHKKIVSLSLWREGP
jgi:hypothetical protein